MTARWLLTLALLPAAAGAQVRPMPSYDDGTTASTYPYREETTTTNMRAEAMARAAHDADLRCAGPGAKPAAVTKCRRARLAAEKREAEARNAQADYADRVARFHVRAAACQAGDPDACY
jgi:hypothetical protein